MTLDAISSIAIYRLKRLTSKPRKLEQVNLSIERLLCCVICRTAVMRKLIADILHVSEPTIRTYMQRAQKS